MKAIHWTIAAALLALVQPVHAAATDPEKIIYRFTGVTDLGGPIFTGVATVFFCTSLSDTDETVRFVIRSANGTLMSNLAEPISHLQTITIATHIPSVFTLTRVMLLTGPLNQGTTAIAATSINIFCKAVIIDLRRKRPSA